MEEDDRRDNVVMLGLALLAVLIIGGISVFSIFVNRVRENQPTPVPYVMGPSFAIATPAVGPTPVLETLPVYTTSETNPISIYLYEQQWTSEVTRLNLVAHIDPAWDVQPYNQPQAMLQIGDLKLIDESGAELESWGYDGPYVIEDGYNYDRLNVSYVADFARVSSSDRAPSYTLQGQLELEGVPNRLVDLDVESYEVGDTWEPDQTVTVGEASMRLQQVEWVDAITFRLTFDERGLSAESPAPMQIVCLFGTNNWEGFYGEAAYVCERGAQPLTIEITAHEKPSSTFTYSVFATVAFSDPLTLTFAPPEATE